MKKANRIISPVLALLVLPVMYFMPILNVFVSSSLVTNSDGTKQNVISKYLGMQQYMSIDYLVKFAKNPDRSKIFQTILDAIQGSDKNAKISDVIPSINWLYAAAAFLAVVVIAMLVVILVLFVAHIIRVSKALAAKDLKLAAPTKKGKKVLNTVSVAGSVTGAVSVILANVCFNKFAEPFLSGRINVSSILTSSAIGGDTMDKLASSLGSLSGLVNQLVSVDMLQLGSAYIFALLIIVTMAVISVCGIFSKD